MGRFRKATRTKARARVAFDGPSGSGKTMSALRLAFTLGKRVAVIDSERGSASLYAGLAPDGVPFDFDVLEMKNFAPTEFTAAITEAGQLGYDVIVVDSLSHAWEGKGGALELKDQQAATSRDNSYTAWGKITPMQRRLVDAILMSPAHVIVTMRSKTEYVLETDDKGRSVPRKVGMAPVQRPGMEYEFTVYASMDWTHTLTVSKSRCDPMADQVCVKPGAGFWRPFVTWLEEGDDAPSPTQVVAEQSQQQPTATTPPVETKAAPAPVATPTVPGKLTDVQMALLVDLRGKMFAGLSSPAEEKAAAWRAELSVYGVTSAKELTPDHADQLIASMVGRFDPFAGAPKPAGA